MADQTAYSRNSMPDLISSSVNIDITDDDKKNLGGLSGPMYPFMSNQNQSGLSGFLRELIKVLQHREAKPICYLLVFCFISTVVMLYWCHITNSMALTAFSFILIFDILCLLTSLVSIWTQEQHPSEAYSFGYERFEVLAVFSCTMLAQLGAFFIFKESVEFLLLPETPEIHIGRLLVGAVFGLATHLTCVYCLRCPAFSHVMDAASSSWLQEHVTDMSESLCAVVPGLSKLLLPRINPFSLIGFCCSLALAATYLAIDTHEYHASDSWASILIAMMIFGTMFPMSSYTGKILLQTTPPHVLGQLDKLLREASTLDGVLEFRHEHFWTLAFGSMAGCVQVRVRRDADEQLVLAHVYTRLHPLVSQLTIQIFKDDWSRPPAYSSSYSTPAPAPPRPTPTIATPRNVATDTPAQPRPLPSTLS